MKLNFTRLRPGNADFRKVKQLYMRAFPDDERAPFLMLVLKAKKKGVDFWSVSCDGKWAGMLYIVSRRDLSYIFYLAVSEEYRGKGIGSAILKSAQQLYKGQRLFLAIEELDKNAENYSERVGRRRFYLRNGFEELHRKLREGSVIYEILGTGGDVKAHEYEALMKGYAGSILSRLFTMEFVDQ
ncbi:GNAT family N-acetyltransferase [Ruminococcus flavefaciens]|uniref:GNAT family N-acetyltransferase n=1 Tax=Ruminococcus flavefaciens TaxID=1265 RepID=UPI0026F2B002|nr:GNAT family N-acetyltransferase [Ruminococcus flavefaciens]